VSGVLTAVGVVLGLLALLLAVPLRVAFEFERVEAFKGRLTFRWLFGLVRFRVHVPGARKPPQESKAVPARVKPSIHRQANVLAVLREAEFRRRVYRLIRELVRAAHVRRLQLRMRVGLGDPADTGRLWALMGPLSAVVRNLRDADVQFEPDFVDPVFEVQARGGLLLIPLQFILLAISFAISPVSIRAWFSLRGSNA